MSFESLDKDRLADSRERWLTLIAPGDSLDVAWKILMLAELSKSKTQKKTKNNKCDIMAVANLTGGESSE